MKTIVHYVPVVLSYDGNQIYYSTWYSLSIICIYMYIYILNNV